MNDLPTTDHRRKSASTRFSANLYFVPQRHIQLRHTFLKIVWNWGQFAFAAIESDTDQPRTEWLYGPSKFGSQLQIWWTKSRHTLTGEFNYRGVRQWILPGKLYLNVAFQTNVDIPSTPQFHNRVYSTQSKQHLIVPTNTKHMEHYGSQDFPLLHRRQSETD